MKGEGLETGFLVTSMKRCCGILNEGFRVGKILE